MKSLLYKCILFSCFIVVSAFADAQTSEDSIKNKKAQKKGSNTNKINITLYMLCYVEDGKIIKVEYQKVEGDLCSKEQLEECKKRQQHLC